MSPVLETIPPNRHVYRIEQIFLFVRVTNEPGSIEIDRVTDMIAEGTKDFSPIYSGWFGKSVLLLVAIRQCRFPLPCSIVGESVADVRVRIKPGWELAVRKDLILAVEEYVVALDSWAN